MHTLLFSKVGSVLALPAIFRPLYFLGYFLPDRRKREEGKRKREEGRGKNEKIGSQAL
jgi:hypothetical protein